MFVFQSEILTQSLRKSMDFNDLCIRLDSINISTPSTVNLRPILPAPSNDDNFVVEEAPLRRIRRGRGRPTWDPLDFLPTIVSCLL